MAHRRSVTRKPAPRKAKVVTKLGKAVGNVKKKAITSNPRRRGGVSASDAATGYLGGSKRKENPALTPKKTGKSKASTRKGVGMGKGMGAAAVAAAGSLGRKRRKKKKR